MNEEMYDIIADVIEDYAYQTFRTILVAYKEVPAIPTSWEELQRDLTFLALVGIKDPLRKGVKESIEVCKRSGIRVRMITGDNKRTAIAMAKESGILA
jgi:P-type E1-E2 ATPase